MKKLKKSIVLLLAVLLALSVIAVPVSAEESEEDTFAGGLIWDDYLTDDEDYEGIIYFSNAEEPRAYGSGDLDGDCMVTAADARICLRVAAKLTVLTDEQKNAADVFDDGHITSNNARRILRAAAKLDVFFVDELTIQVGEKCQVRDLFSSGSGMYLWYATPNEDGLKVTDAIIDSAEPGTDRPAPGSSVKQIFTFTAMQQGTYIIHFTKKASWETIYIADFYIKITVVSEEGVSENYSEEVSVEI